MTDIDVELGSYGQITGRVSVPEGYEVGAVVVSVKDVETGNVVGYGYPQSDGSYQVAQLPRGRYLLRFDSWQQLASTVYDGSATGTSREADAREVEIDAAGQVVDHVDQAISVAAHVVIDDPEERGVWRIRLYSADDPVHPLVDSNTGCHVYYCGSDVMQHVLPGEYKVLVNEDLWIGGDEFASAQLVTLTAGEETHLTRPDDRSYGHVSGRALNAGGGVSGLRVSFFRGDATTPTQSVITDSSGHFTAYYLPVGGYRVRVADPDDGYATTWYLNAGSRAEATSVDVHLNQYGESVHTQLDPVRMLRLVTNGTAPAVAGTTRVGETLTAADGGWTPSPVSTTRQWLRDGQPIEGATGATYLLVPGDLGSRISVAVTGAKNGFATRTVESDRTAAVLPGVLTSTPVPTISGTTKVGKVLTASAGTWGPAPVDLTYAWFRSGLGEPVGHGATYTLKPDDRSKTLTVQVTGTKSGYESATRTSVNTAAIGAGDLTAATPTITGGPATVGSPLVGSSGTWGPSPVDLSYAWYREGTTAAVGAGEIYTPAADDLDKTLTLKVTGTKTAYTTITRTSVATPPVIAGSLTAPTPTVAGTPRFGKRLSAVPGAWAPGTVSFAYQWSRDGEPVAGATDQTYLLDIEDIGSQLTVAVTGAKPGYTAQTRSSAPTAPIAEATMTEPATPTVAGATTVGSTLLVTSSGWGPGAVDKTYQWQRGGVDIDDATSRSYRVTAEDLDAVLTVVVRGTKEGYTPRTVVSDPAAPIGPGALGATTPTITGTAAAGSRLRVAVGNWGPAPVDLTYQWIRDGADAPGATGLSYELTQEDVGSTLAVRVTGAKAGYVTESRFSEPTAQVGEGTLTSTIPTISGDVVVNKLLTAVPGAWGPGSVDLTYQWSTGSGPIEDATNRTYRLTAEDLGGSVTVAVTGSKSGFATTTRTSAATTPVAEATFGSTPTPTISGVARFGQRLRAQAGTWLPTPDELRYQWLRDGVPIAGATDPLYDLGSPDVDTRVKVTITAVRAGFSSASRTSEETATVAAGTFTTAPVPTVSGTTTVGEVLTAAPGTWSPEPVQLSYQWRRAGVDIPAATGPTYLLDGKDAGQRLTVQVTGSRPGYTTVTKNSAATPPVTKGTLTATPTPTISGTPKVTAKLTAVPGTWSPDPVALDYQWSRDGVAIDGAVGRMYVVTPEDVGGNLSVVVTGSKLGYTSESRGSAATATVISAALSATPIPTIAGVPQVGQDLVVLPGAWSPDPVTLTYQWFRDGVVIKGAVLDTYSIVAADLGKPINVRVRGAKSGYTTAVRASAPTDPVTPGELTVTTQPTIDGEAKVGRRLSAIRGAWAPGPVTFQYGWRRDGVPIAGAASSTYVLTADDLGAQISVSVVGSKAGYVPVTRTSELTGPVSPGTLTNTPVPTVSGTATVGSTLTAVKGTWTPGPVSLTFQWYADGVAIDGATAQTLTLRPTEQGKRLVVAVTGSKQGYESVTRSSAATPPVT